LYFLVNKNSLAAPCFDKAVQLRSDLPGLWVLRGVNYLQSDSLDQAENNFSKAVTNFSDDPEINYYLGFTYNRKKESEKALIYLEKADRLDPNNLQTLLALSALYDELQDYTRSEPIYKKMLKLRPDSPIVLNNYAYHLSVRNQNLPEALQMVSKALDSDPQNSAFLDTKGWIQFQMHDYENAMKNIEKSYNLKQDSAEVAEHLGDVYEKLNDLTKAQAYWQKALELDKSKDHLKEKIGRSSP
jgi:tetratricopeptide (TPR) repeat protein